LPLRRGDASELDRARAAEAVRAPRQAGGVIVAGASFLPAGRVRDRPVVGETRRATRSSGASLYHSAKSRRSARTRGSGVEIPAARNRSIDRCRVTRKRSLPLGSCVDGAQALAELSTARTCIRTGSRCRLTTGQNARATAGEAYWRGAIFVDVVYFDPYVKRERMLNADPDTLEFVLLWCWRARVARRAERRTHRPRGVVYPDVFAGIDLALSLRPASAAQGVRTRDG
jgi:hypothetical protein